MMLVIKTCSNYTLYFFFAQFPSSPYCIVTDQSCLSINGKCYTEDRYCNCLESITNPTVTYITEPIDEGTKPNNADITRLVFLQSISPTSMLFYFNDMKIDIKKYYQYTIKRDVLALSAKLVRKFFCKCFAEQHKTLCLTYM